MKTCAFPTNNTTWYSRILMPAGPLVSGVFSTRQKNSQTVFS